MVTSSTGTFADVRISVSDGKASSGLPAFSISVTGNQLGSATLSWQPPTENTDGTPLTNLAGYLVRYGTSPGSLTTQVKLANAGLTTYVVSDLAPATWYFQVSAYNASGVESAPSATVIQDHRLRLQEPVAGDGCSAVTSRSPVSMPSFSMRS